MGEVLPALLLFLGGLGASVVVGTFFRAARDFRTSTLWLITSACLALTLLPVLSGPRDSNQWFLATLFSVPLFLTALISRIPDVRESPSLTFWVTTVSFAFSLVLWGVIAFVLFWALFWHEL